MHAPNFEAFYNDAAKFEQRYICKVLDRVDLVVALGDDWKEYYQTLTKTKVIVVNNAVLFLRKIAIKLVPQMYSPLDGSVNEKGARTFCYLLSEFKGKCQSSDFICTGTRMTQLRRLLIE